MNYLQQYADFTTNEEGIEKLKEAVKLRDQMGGAMYWNIMNEDCCEIADKLSRMGADRDQISAILGVGTHSR